MPTLTFLLGLFFAAFNNSTAPTSIAGGKTIETKTTVDKGQADYIIIDDQVGRKP